MHLPGNKKCQQCGKPMADFSWGFYCSKGCEKTAELTKKQLEALDKSSKEEAQKSESSSNPVDQKPGIIKRLITASFKATFYLFSDRKGNIILSIAGILGFIGSLISGKTQELHQPLLMCFALILISIFRSYKVYKNSELKFHQQLGEDCLGALRDIFNIMLNEKVV